MTVVRPKITQAETKAAAPLYPICKSDAEAGEGTFKVL